MAPRVDASFLLKRTLTAGRSLLLGEVPGLRKNRKSRNYNATGVSNLCQKNNSGGTSVDWNPSHSDKNLINESFSLKYLFLNEF